VAQALISGVRRKKFFILPGFHTKIIFYAKRFVPELVYKIMDRDAKKSSTQ